jgi:CPA2 family monovalent cation:H+ antiporter-2
MHSEPLIPIFVFVMLAILVVTMTVKKFKQPYVVAYLLTGILLGPYGVDLISDTHSLSRLGEVGVILLLFFAGMEISPRKFAENWKVPTLGTMLQISVTMMLVYLFGSLLNYAIANIVLFGFVICLSSTAVVLKLLQDSGSLRTRLGQNVLGVLLVQDLAVVPMLIIIGILGGTQPTTAEITVQIIGGILVMSLATFMAVKKNIKVPFLSKLGRDEEMRVFAALIICFGMAAITGELGLSLALGAFIGGMTVATLEETEWVGHSLNPVKTIFMALFFISIGMLIDLNMVWDKMLQFAVILVAIFFLNTAINTIIFKSLHQKTSESLIGGAMLSQIGEFSFVLISMGYSLNIITDYMYAEYVTLVSLSLLFSPLWISSVKMFIRKFINK